MRVTVYPQILLPRAQLAQWTSGPVSKMPHKKFFFNSRPLACDTATIAFSLVLDTILMHLIFRSCCHCYIPAPISTSAKSSGRHRADANPSPSPLFPPCSYYVIYQQWVLALSPTLAKHSWGHFHGSWPLTITCAPNL